MYKHDVVSQFAERISVELRLKQSIVNLREGGQVREFPDSYDKLGQTDKKIDKKLKLNRLLKAEQLNSKPYENEEISKIKGLYPKNNNIKMFLQNQTFCVHSSRIIASLVYLNIKEVWH